MTTTVPYTHDASGAFVRAAELLSVLTEVCPEAAWIGGHLVRAIANVEAIHDLTDFDIAVPRSKLDAIEAHVFVQAGWSPEPADATGPDGNRTPLLHRRWKTERFTRDEPGWPQGVAVDLVIYDDTAGETLAGLVGRVDLNVLRLWATLAGEVLRHPAPAGWARVPITEDLYLCIETQGPNAYDAILSGDVQLVPGAWTRPWRLAKYRIALGLGPIPGVELPLNRPPGGKREDLPPVGFKWIEWKEIQLWRNAGANRAPWVLGDLDAYTNAQALHDRAVERAVATPVDFRTEWVWLDGAKVRVQNVYVLTSIPGNPAEVAEGQYVREWEGELNAKADDPEERLLLRVLRFPEDVFERIMALRGGV